MTGDHVLYRFYDATGRLLYVGITVHLPNRLTDHRHGKPWWTNVTRITLEHHPDRTSVLTAERDAIRNERPEWNVIHNRETQPVISRGWGSTPDDMPDDCHDYCVPTGILSIYYPWKWGDGIGTYTCDAGHTWTCGWGHNASGSAPQWAGRPAHRDPVTLPPRRVWRPRPVLRSLR